MDARDADALGSIKVEWMDGCSNVCHSGARTASITSGGKRGSSVVRHLPLVLEVPGSIPARGEKKFGVRTRFL